MGRPLGSKNKISSLQKFLTYHKVDEETGCWNWVRAISNKGYGNFRQDGHLLAHRWAYARFQGAIPEGLWVLHSCDNRRCVNPAHLFLGTVEDNNRDMADKGRQWLQDPTRRADASSWFRSGSTMRVGTKWAPERHAKHSEFMRAYWAERRMKGK